MDEVATLLGATVTSLLVGVALLKTQSIVVLVAAIAVGGVLTGAGSRSFQSEFRDAWVAGTLGFVVGVNVVFVGLGGWQKLALLFWEEVGSVNRPQTARAVSVAVAGSFMSSVGLSPVFGLAGAVGGRYGARLRRTVENYRQQS